MEATMRRWVLVMLALDLTACKMRKPQAPAAEVEEAGAGQIDNDAWFKRFDAHFDRRAVAAAIVQIQTVDQASGDILLSHLEGWPTNGAFPPLPNQPEYPYSAGVATGFFVAPNGLGITNHHVMEECVSGAALNRPRKCPGFRAILGTVFTEPPFVGANVEAKLNDDLVDVAERNQAALEKDARIADGRLSLNGALHNEVLVRLHQMITAAARAERTFDVCLVSAVDDDFDAVVVKFVPLGADCRQDPPPQAFLAPQLEPAAVGKRVFSAGFGSKRSGYVEQLENSKAELFNPNEVNFTTGLIGEIAPALVRTVTNHETYPKEQNFEAMDTFQGHSGAPEFYDVTPPATVPTVVAVHAVGMPYVEPKEQDGVAMRAVLDRYFMGDDCVRAHLRDVGACLRSR
jgi:hypothetical protein